MIGTTRNLTFIAVLIFCCNFNISNPSEKPSQQGNTSYIEINGSKLQYVVEGNGIPCLVIGSHIYYPKTFSNDLRNYMKMYFVDMKWFAEDYAPEDLDSVNIQTIIEDVAAIQSKLGLEKPVIMGHSIHGTIAMEYVKKYAGNIGALVIIGSPSQFGNTTFDQKAKDLWESSSEERKTIQKQNWGEITEIDRLTGKEATAAAYNRAAPQYWYDPYYDANWLWDGMTVHTEVTDHLFSTVFSNYDMFKDPQEIPIPVFVAMGKYDYVIPYTLWEEAYDHIPDYTLVLFEKSGHTPQLEESVQFDKKLINWLQLRFQQNK